MGFGAVHCVGGAVWAWGSGAVGQLGQGSRIPEAPHPLRIPGYGTGDDGQRSTTGTRPPVVAIAAGALHSALITGERISQILMLKYVVAWQGLTTWYFEDLHK